MKIDLLNIGLMIFSLVLAIFIPFELLIISYAFLGPLHYLTEINWLEDKKFFSKSKKWLWFFILATLILVFKPTVDALSEVELFKGLNQNETLKPILAFSQEYSGNLLFISLATAITLVFTAKWYVITLSVILSTVASILFASDGFEAIFAIFLPTLIHVYIFTAIFMLYGALKGKSNLGLLSVLLLILIPVFIFNLDVNASDYAMAEIFNPGYVSQALEDSNFYALNYFFLKYFGMQEDFSRGFDILSGVAIKAQIFIAFAYIYHYLNWFSKTTVIKWHKSFSKKRIIFIVTTYVISIGIYAINFKAGFITMFFLSFLHVLLEFPLNVVSIKGIGQELRSRISGAKA